MTTNNTTTTKRAATAVQGADLARIHAMQPGETVICKGVARATVAYHARQQAGDYRVSQCGEDVRVERLGWQWKAKPRGKPPNLSPQPAVTVTPVSLTPAEIEPEEPVIEPIDDGWCEIAPEYRGKLAGKSGKKPAF